MKIELWPTKQRPAGGELGYKCSARYRAHSVSWHRNQAALQGPGYRLLSYELAPMLKLAVFVSAIQ